MSHIRLLPNRRPPSYAAQRGRALWWGGAAVLAVALGAGGWWWYTQQQAAGDAAAAPATGAPKRFAGGRVQPVTVAEAQQRDINVIIPAIGNMAALNTAVVRARVDGELKAIHFREGENVRAGQLLAELDARAFDVQLAQAQGQLARDQAQLRNAQLDLDRYKDLLSKDAVARQQVDTQEALVRQLQGTVQADQAQVDNAKLQLSYTKVTAPIAGRIGLKQVDLGSIARSSDANGLATITQTRPIALVFAVAETHLPRMRRKLNGKDPMEVEAWDRDQRNLLGVGKVVTTDNVIDAATGTIKIKAEFPNADGALFPNQFVNVKMKLDVQRNALAVPSAAIQRGAQGIFVYVVQSDNTVTVKRVRPGATDGDWVAVTGELAAGDKLVTDGADRLREGAQVDVVVPPRPGGGGKAEGKGSEKAAEAPANTAPNAAPNPSPNASGGAVTSDKPADPSASKTADKPVEKSTASRPDAGAAPAASAPAQAAKPTAAGASDLPPWFDRLPPDVQERYKAMNPEERKAFIEKLRERRRQREEQGQ